MWSFGKLQRKHQRSLKQGLDIDTLTLAATAIENSPLVATTRRISKMAAALEICLRQQESLLVTSPEFPSRDVILRNVTVAKALSEKIRAELQSNSNGDGTPSKTDEIDAAA